MSKNEETKGLIEDLRTTEGASLSREGCLILANLIEEKQNEIDRLGKMPFIEVNNELRAKVAHYERVLRRIDSDIRCTKDPVPFIVSTLKEVLPEYK